MARAKHYDDESLVYHFTTRTLDQQFHLADPREKRRVVSALDFYRRRGDFKLYGFVVMDNHMHAVIQPASGRILAEIARDFKTWTSRVNVSKPEGETLWERRYDDNTIEGLDELRAILDYIHNNPVRAGVVSVAEEYPWSSVHNYLRDGKQLIEVDMDWW
jgi:REP element-mobilizing transposase RayT